MNEPKTCRGNHVLVSSISEDLEHLLSKKVIPFIQPDKLTVICGNGGSAAEASHFAGELIPIGLPCIALNDMAAVTAIANDHSYDEIYTHQLKAFQHLIGFAIFLSTSGQSPNIRHAASLFQSALLKEHGPGGLVITGKDPHPNLIHPPSFSHHTNWSVIQIDFSSTQRIQEFTLRILHIIYDFFLEKQGRWG